MQDRELLPKRLTFSGVPSQADGQGESRRSNLDALELCLGVLPSAHHPSPALITLGKTGYDGGELAQTKRRTAMPVIDVQVHPFDRNHPGRPYRRGTRITAGAKRSETRQTLKRTAPTGRSSPSSKLSKIRQPDEQPRPICFHRDREDRRDMPHSHAHRARLRSTCRHWRPRPCATLRPV